LAVDVILLMSWEVQRNLRQMSFSQWQNPIFAVVHALQ